jgi:dTDP-glucose 4,6-dehydratase
MKILITGGCGFIGHHLVEHIYKNTDWTIYIIDKLTYASKGLDRLRDLGFINDPRIHFYCFDLSNKLTDGLKKEIGDDISIIVHMAAETHIPTSIDDPELFVTNNIFSTLYTLEWARELPSLTHYIYFSTDEVYGSAPNGCSFDETAQQKPSNPYSASKAASENLCLAYQTTFKIPMLIINVMNAIGERQYVEKFLPHTIKTILHNNTLQIHCDSHGVPTTRHYVHCRNIADAVLFIIRHGTINEKIHISGEQEIDNLTMAKMIANIMNMELKYELVSGESKRPGIDVRYDLCGDKLFNMGWKPPIKFEHSLRKTILWTLEHKKWLND